MSDVSVIVCTHRIERWQWLLECLASLDRQVLQPLEVIVVVDGNKDILKRLTERGGRQITLSTVYPSGLSSARNLGLTRASGEFVAFLDDDAIASPEWLKYLRAVLEDETVAGVGGVSLPKWDGSPPKWLPQELLWTLGCSYRGMPRTRSDVRNVYGGSACFRKNVFTRFGTFNTKLGRMGVGFAGCEETELCVRVRNQAPDLRFVHEPDAVIYHRVPKERQRLMYILKRCLGEGHSKAILRAAVGRGHGHPLVREANYLLRTVPLGIGWNVGRMARGDVWGLARAVVLLAAVVATMEAYESTRALALLGRSETDATPQLGLTELGATAQLSHSEAVREGTIRADDSQVSH